MMLGRDFMRHGYTTESNRQHERIAEVSIAQLLGQQRSGGPQTRETAKGGWPLRRGCERMRAPSDLPFHS
jgi:hypothetical protein